MNIHSYLHEKVGKVVPDSLKIYNEGARLLANFPDWEDHLNEIIDSAWDSLVKYCIRNRSATHSASVKLTFGSTTIGKSIARFIDVETSVKNTLALGDLILEAFLQDNLIEIYREYEGRAAPYMVRILKMPNTVKTTLGGTLYQKPDAIKGLISPYTKEPFIKGWSDGEQFKEYISTPHIQALDKLRQTGWEINRSVLDVLIKNPPKDHLVLTNKDGVIFDYPLLRKPKKIPNTLYHLDGTKFLGNLDAKLQKAVSKYFEHNQVVKKASLIVKNNDGKFWQEATCDYRGRMYYAESFLEYQGSDSARSLFLFQEAKEVDAAGMYWMQVHAANCYNESFTVEQLKQLTWPTTDYVKHLETEGLDTISVDKMTLEDRAAWTKNKFGWICDLGRTKQLRPEAEKPYGFLAVCVEIANTALIGLNVYKSKLPIPIDGSNNGWQHLAAISKDKQAGALVSLVPTPIQKDFYVAVAKDLIRIMPDWFEEKAMPMKHIRKGISKRGSMTRAYSAGTKRIAKNMYDDCHVEGFTVKYDITEQDCGELAVNLIQAINTVCAGPLKTTKFLQKVAEHELSQGRNFLSWTSPSGFPVVYKAFLQHEFKQRGTIRGIPGSKDGRVQHVVRTDVIGKESGERVACRRSFASGISPNYIHSLDAAHMANVIVNFRGSFAAVHDSFACHARDVDLLQEVTKAQFVKQYDVENFFNYIQESVMLFADSFKYPQPKLGKLNVRDVLKSKYFFC